MTNDTRYNGWTNYATWRINLEMVDGMDGEGFDLDQEAYELGDDLKSYCESYIEDTTPAGLGRDYALAFMSDVNWSEIAQSMIDTWKDEDETYDEYGVNTKNSFNTAPQV
jgi:hypothetical protein